MQINWMVLTYFVIGFFALAGFSRGWWKEALTMVVLALFVFLLQQPDLAQDFIDGVNNFFATTWNLIPLSLQPAITDLFAVLFDINTGGGPIQFDASSPNSWLAILALTLALTILLSRLWLIHAPNRRGNFLGLLIGGANGFIIINLVREYLDGRGLPGNVAPATEIVLAGNSAFGTPASSLAIQAASLPNFTILDSVIPWIVVGVGVLFAFSLVKTRLGILTVPDKGRKINHKVPPFYRKPLPAKKPEKPEDLIKKLFS
jgi:hypothetical protein